ncbi:sacsin N-terminal ATP-binding-like domain-containing protein [Serratia fonticola]|uniref:sacsin N-terminal ATP-binding-like domain-containing protein n=1 Tax=Serratia fonticola TaxID=47917 RepID=UPI0021AE209C|nr:DUF3883 domain-containing protein [Serratia fonticola]
MSEILDQQHLETQQAVDDLRQGVKSVIEHAVQAYRKELKVYQSLQNLNEVIGTEYGNRVIYELIQNAHDAHQSDECGRIAVSLCLVNASQGTLYIANEGRGFRLEDVEAIKNLAISSKGIGEGIGNKGLGFRSIEALTQSVRIYSRSDAKDADRFDGYCFRFADVDEIVENIRAFGVDEATSESVSKMLPRYLVPVPLEEQPDDVRAFARKGYSTVIVAPLETEAAVNLATKQVQELTNHDVPLMLFLDRITEISIEILETGSKPERHTMQREQMALGCIPDFPDVSLYAVNIGHKKRFLLAKNNVEKARVEQAVKCSLSTAPQLKRWLDWKGVPVVSVAVGLTKSVVTSGRLYNFLPMAADATSPIHGYIDAPFFADIDRRNANMNLPLNQLLMEAAAETCTIAALSIVARELDIPTSVVFDLFAWTGNHRHLMQAALGRQGLSFTTARLIPAIAPRGKQQWSSLGEVSIWPEGQYTVLNAREVAKHCNAQLVLPDFGSLRTERLREIRRNYYVPHFLDPSAKELAQWAETFAHSLLKRDVPFTKWGKFYDELVTLFAAAKVKLNKLEGYQILYDRQKKLRPAGGHTSNEHSGVFVRRSLSNGAKTKEKKNKSIPLPPPLLSRRYLFLNEKITFIPATFTAFTSAELIREYDPIKALSGLKMVLRKNTTPKQREEALLWAFEVWLSSSVAVDAELKKADLYVPVQSGWCPARKTLFSSSWTEAGKITESYLTGAAEISEDCRKVSGFLLVEQQNWPVRVHNSKTDWSKFLRVLGVTDGLQPVTAQLKMSEYGDSWNRFLLNGDADEGFDDTWRADVNRARISFPNPQTVYTTKGNIWRLPGQLEYSSLPEDLREQLCVLIFIFLKMQSVNFFTFEVGRFERAEADRNSRTLPTPLAVFLRTRAWLTITSTLLEGVSFSRADACWASGSRERRTQPPRFIGHLIEQGYDFSEESLLTERLFSSEIGLRDWRDAATAFDRMRELVKIVPQLGAGDRPVLQQEYQRSWSDILASGETLPAWLDLIVLRGSQFEVLRGNSAHPPAVIVTDNTQKFEAQMLASAGAAVLNTGQEVTEKLITLLGQTGQFSPCKIDGGGVQLFLDGELFSPDERDPLLISFDMSWLPDVLGIGLELLGENLERGVQAATVERKIRAIRVRRSRTLSLAVQGKDATPMENFICYAWPHETSPTLVIEESLEFNWVTFARLSRNLSRLVDTRLRFIETLFLRLTLESGRGSLNKPDDETLARVMNCNIQTIRDHYARLCTDIAHVIAMLLPVIAYYKDIALARELQREFALAGATFDVRSWAASHLCDTYLSYEEILSVCEESPDRAELRRKLSLDYQRFNQVLKELGEETLSNQDTLHRMFSAYLDQLRPDVIDRLRRHYFATFEKGDSLAEYVGLKSMEFITFDPEWVFTYETLDKSLMVSHIAAQLDKDLGADNAEVLPALNTLLDVNRKMVREFVMKAQPLVSIWCRQNGISAPALWQQPEPQTLCRQFENKGLLDFKRLELDSLPDYCLRAGVWPKNMPLSLDDETLSIDMSGVSEEEKRVEQVKRLQELERRSISLGDQSMDTTSPLFADKLQDLAKDYSSWLARSPTRTQSLVDFGGTAGRQTSGVSGGKSTGRAYRDAKLTPAQKEAMGLVSELLAFKYLQFRFPEYTNDTSWVSGNRARFLGGTEGNDSAGYDFIVKTPSHEYFFEVKSTLEDSQEFELTANELHVASSMAKDGSKRYRILYVPYVFSPDKWCVIELPNPMGDKSRRHFSVVRQGALRLRFQRDE